MDSKGDRGTKLLRFLKILSNETGTYPYWRGRQNYSVGALQTCASVLSF